MPIYEYQCQDCKAVQEEIQKMGEGHEKLTCKKCGSVSLKKVLSVIARTPGASTINEPCEAAGSCPSGGCCHGCGVD